MLDNFDHLVVVNRTDGLIKSNFSVTFDPQTESSPEHSPAGDPIVYVKEPTDNARHIALGRFMDAWSQLESSIASALCDATGLKRENADVLMNALGTRGQLDVITLLGPADMNDRQRSELSALIERVRTNNTRRNYIVHGNWVLEIRLYNANGKVLVRLHQQRRYPVSDAAVRHSLNRPENKRDRAKYVFTISRINSIAKELIKLKKDFSMFLGARRGMSEGAQRYLVTVQAEHP